MEKCTGEFSVCNQICRNQTNPCGPGTVMGPGGQCRPAGPLGNPCGPGTVMGPGGQCRPAGPLGNPCGPGSVNGSRRTM